MWCVVFRFERVCYEIVRVVLVNIPVISSWEMVAAGIIKRGQIIPRHLRMPVMDRMKTIVQKQKGPKPLALNHNSARAGFFMGAMFQKSTYFQKIHRKIASKKYHRKGYAA